MHFDQIHHDFADLIAADGLPVRYVRLDPDRRFGEYDFAAVRTILAQRTPAVDLRLADEFSCNGSGSN